MKKINQNQANKQQGVASLLIALVLLICITLITLFTSKTVLMETKMIADNHRIVQAVSAANYSMDLGVNYFDGGGFDQNDGLAFDTPDTFIDTVADVTGDAVFDNLNALSLGAIESLVNPGGGDEIQATSGTLLFENNVGSICVKVGGSVVPTMKHGLIRALGESDDKAAERTITQCVGPLDILSDDGPDQPLVAQGQINLTGSANIINRYTSTNIWSGDEINLSGSSISTYIKGHTSTIALPADIATFLDTDETVETQLVSNKNLGLGLDIIDDDPSLGGLTGEAFFTNFFTSPSREAYKNMAKSSGIYSTNIADAINTPGDVKSGIIWIESPGALVQITAATQIVGSIDKPAILVINGNFKQSGGTIYGLLYVIGKYEVVGNTAVIGAAIVEGTDIATGTPASPPTVFGTGALTLVYWPDFLKSTPSPPPGLTAVVDGSWKDWVN